MLIKTKFVYTTAIMLTVLILISSCGVSSMGGAQDSRAVDLTSEEYKGTVDILFITAPTVYCTGWTTEIPDYGGYEFKFLNSSVQGHMYTYIDSELTGFLVDDLCYERNLSVEERFNIKISEDIYPIDSITSYARNLILSEENAYDAIYLPLNEITPLISEELFCDLLEIGELHTEQIWWDQPLIVKNAIEDSLFYATSDLHLMALDSIGCTFFYEDMVLSLGIELPYIAALDGKWTFEMMKQYCAAAADINGEAVWGTDVDGKDKYTFVDIAGYRKMAYAQETSIVTPDYDGYYTFTADTDERFLSVWEGLKDFYTAENGVFLAEDEESALSIFKDGRSLFLNARVGCGTLINDNSGRSFGALPLPKYDEEQENYESAVVSDCLAFCIPVTNKRLERTGIIVDYLTYESYKEVIWPYLSLQVDGGINHVAAIDVLTVIRGTRGVDPACIYGWDVELISYMEKRIKNNEPLLASDIRAYKDDIVSRIEATYSTYPSPRH